MAGLLKAPLTETTGVLIEGITGLDFGRVISNKSVMSDVLMFDKQDDELTLLDPLILSLRTFLNCDSIK